MGFIFVVTTTIIYKIFISTENQIAKNDSNNPNFPSVSCINQSNPYLLFLKIAIVLKAHFSILGHVLFSVHSGLRNPTFL